MSQRHESFPTAPLPEEKIDDLGHIIRAGAASETDADYNPQIDVFSRLKEGDRAQIYQMWAIDKFASNPIAFDALKAFGLAGDGATEKEKWTQLLEHISGVTAIADHIENLLEKYGVTTVDKEKLEAATLFDSLQKPYAIEAGIELRDESPLRTATLVHDIEKPAELAAAKEMRADSAGGLENSLDNPVLLERQLGQNLHEHGESDDVILAAQNTGRSDRFYSSESTYEKVVDDAVRSGSILESEKGEVLESLLKKASLQRDALGELLHEPSEVIEAMSPAERRNASIEAKGMLAALVGFSDAMAAQFKLQGLSEASIDDMKNYYLSRKKDPESVAFFGEDWPEYYKAVRRYLISQIPEQNRDAFTAELDNLTHERVFNETVLPEVLGTHAMQHEAGESTTYDKLKYKMELIGSWTKAKNADPTKNEDVTIANNEVFVLADGATDKTGITYPSGKSGGRELADIAAQVAARSEKSGYELADEITQAVRAFYEANNPDALEDPSKRAATTLVTARVVGDKTVITQIGDSNIRVTFKDGTRQVFTNDKLIDEENARLRSDYIQRELSRFNEENGREPSDEERSEIIASGRGVIQQRLNEQYKLQNITDDSTYGYGTIDGTIIPRTFTDGTPTGFVKEYTLDSESIDTIELVSDGFYGAFPDVASQTEYAALHERLHAEDPDKYLKYLSTKPNDDAAVLIARLI